MSKFKQCVHILFPKGINKWNYLKQMSRNESRDNLKILKDNEKFKNQYKGQRCFILGNGPSLNRQNLSLLKGEYVFTANKFSKVAQSDAVNSTFHFVSDPSFFTISEELNDFSFYEDLKKMARPDNSPQFFFTIEAKEYIKKRFCGFEKNTHYLWQCGTLYENCKEEVDFTKSIFNFSTVVCAMILFAIYAGFSEIYLLGCDCTGVLSWIESQDKELQVQSYAYSEKDKSLVNGIMQNRWNSEEYFRDNMILFKQYRLLHDYAERKNVKLVNCTAGGILDVLPRKRLEEVVK